MHYYIDGYNLLFRMLRGNDDLETRRRYIIEELDKKISLTELNMTLVFDAPFQIGERDRSHYRSLEIFFTNHGETADEFIISELKNASNPRQETIVTSDRKLAWHARSLSAQTQGVEEFSKWLDKLYRNKIKQLKKDPFHSTTSSKVPIIKEKIKNNIITIDPSTLATTEECQFYYEEIFQSKYEIIEQEEKEKKLKNTTQEEPVKKKPKPKKKDVFKEVQSPEEKQQSEMERWLRIFEKKNISGGNSL